MQYMQNTSKYHKHGTSATQPDQGYFGNPAMKFRRLSNQAAGAGRDGNENSAETCLDNGSSMQFPTPVRVRG